MKRSRFVLMMLLVVFALPVALHAQESDPATVINAANDAWNAGGADALKALYADDAIVSFPDWGEVITGREQIDEWIEGLVASNFVIEPESIQVEGDTVTVVAKAWADESRALGIAPLVTTDVYTVQGGLITSQTSTLTEESAAKLMASMAAMEPETMPETGGQALPLSGALLALGGMAFLGGLSLLRPSLSGRGR
ncbi:MAG: nuclear transport factor 2 family protein [Anaerolineae bacterium]|jgi:ketosteroid isomerase-like protein